ncbi:MAG: SUMF1/EgtB/PvdO family nonheme iron enzyme [Bacteroidaceae bacterium]|nr:SUMF1/EgtB/PvdO family nonheme iron enzyme [Bacteroidaceae bacterium]
MKKLNFLFLLPLVACFLTLMSCSSSTQKNGETANDSIANDSVANEERVSFSVKGVSFTMILVKGGTFTMGATPEQGNDAQDDEKPAHSVTLSDYYIGETEVTQALYEAVMGDNPSDVKGADLPVVNVEWEDGEFFAAKLSELTGRQFRLPTEAQWEYAARGGNKSQGYKYAGSNTLSDVAWTDDIKGGCHPVKEKAPNELGIYDMSGNVDEYCDDNYAPYSKDSQTDPKLVSEDGGYVTVRGGSYANGANECRVSRRGSSRGYVFASLGFRIAMTAEK